MGAVIEVHRHLGPDLLESVYHRCLAREFQLQGMSYSSEHFVPVHYKGINVGTDLRCDFLVEDTIVLELKAVKEFEPIFTAKVLTYMNLLEKPKGLLVNFNVANIMQKGSKSFVNELYRLLPAD
ncbi:MAG: GxxExxY protein [Bacteroidota bacterium]